MNDILSHAQNISFNRCSNEHSEIELCESEYKKRTFSVIYYFLNSFKWPSIYNLASNNNVLCIELVHVLCSNTIYFDIVFYESVDRRKWHFFMLVCFYDFILERACCPHILITSTILFDFIGTIQISFYADDLYSSIIMKNDSNTVITLTFQWAK